MSQEIPSVPDHVLVRPIGKGAFGEVWLAQNAMSCYRAVKVVRRDTLDSSQHFDREFRGIQRFEPISRNHEGLMDILQVGRSPDDAYFYYVMELGDDLVPRQDFSAEQYEPRTLAAECELRGRVPAPDAALIGAQLAQALGFLHEHGLTHCDIKPSNVLFIRGLPKIGDPGLVSIIDASQSLRGTPGYIAPEGPGTPQADIFSLGKLLYVISTQRQPREFPGLPAEVALDANADYFRRLNLVILRACAHNPADRYATAEELRLDLLEVHAGRSPVETRRRLRLALRAGAVLGGLVVLIGTFYYRARLQANERQARLAQSYAESGIRLDDAHNPLGSLAFFAEALQTAPNPERAEVTARRISLAWRYSPRLLAQWHAGHTINRVAFDPSGRNLALASSHGEVWLWDCSEKPPRLLGRHTGDVPAIVFTRDGRWVISGGTDGMVRFWNLAQPSANHAARAGKPVWCLALHPQKDRLAAGGSEGMVLFLSLAGEEQWRAKASEHRFRSVAFSPDGTRFFAGSEGKEICAWSSKSEQLPTTHLASWVFDIAFSSDGVRRAAASGNRAFLALSDTAPVPSRLRHPTLVRSVCFSPSDPDLLLTACLDQTVRFWSCRDDEEILPPIPTETPPQHAVFAADGRTFAVATFSGLVRVYGMVRPYAGGAGIMAASEDGTRCVHVDGPAQLLPKPVTVTDAVSNRELARFSVPGREVENLAINRDGTRILLGQRSGSNCFYEVWDAVARQRVGATQRTGTMKVDFHPTGQMVALRLNSGLWLWRPPAEPFPVCAWELADPSDAELRFDARSDRLAVVWSTNVLVASVSGQGVRRWSLAAQAYTVDLEPGGERVVVGEQPPGLEPSASRIWEVATATAVGQPFRLDDGCYLARFDPTAERLLLSDEIKNAFLYRRNAGQWARLPRAMRHPGIVVEASFSSDGRWVATQSGDRGGDPPSLRVWDTASGEPVTPEFGTGRQGVVYMVGGGRAVLYSVRRGFPAYWRRWELGALEGPLQDLVDLAHLLACRRVDAAGNTSLLKASELTELWQRLSSRHPEWFAGSPAPQAP